MRTTSHRSDDMTTSQFIWRSMVVIAIIYNMKFERYYLLTMLQTGSVPRHSDP